MADWRQIQARIRKAKASVNPSAQLAELYQRTRDAMVAFELALCYEKAEDHIEAVRWYTSAAERFRRAQWRTKAEEALTRLGAPIPVYPTELAQESKNAESKGAESKEVDKPGVESASTENLEAHRATSAESDGESQESGPLESAASGDESAQGATSTPSSAGEGVGKKRRRRGRRGGRKRRGSTATIGPGQPGGHSSSHTGGRPASIIPQAAPRAIPSRRSSFSAGVAGVTTAGPGSPDVSEAEPHEHEYSAPRGRAASDRAADAHPATTRALSGQPEGASQRSLESAAAPSWHGRTRAGEPALASRISQLESQLRRLLACPLSSLDDADQAPAGPGVLLLSDSDQVTHYYIEACQTLRIGIGNLLRGGRGSKDSGLLKERMAENLGIAEARVSRYLKEHCAVRWLQLDDGAPHLAHFAIAVLRPVVND